MQNLTFQLNISINVYHNCVNWNMFLLKFFEIRSLCALTKLSQSLIEVFVQFFKLTKPTNPNQKLVVWFGLPFLGTNLISLICGFTFQNTKPTKTDLYYTTKKYNFTYMYLVFIVSYILTLLKILKHIYSFTSIY